jgi:hypothetical protein
MTDPRDKRDTLTPYDEDDPTWEQYPSDELYMSYDDEYYDDAYEFEVCTCDECEGLTREHGPA